MAASLPTLAGAVSTAVFVASTLPMLVKAARTKDLSSYSVGNILLSNFGNLVNTIYIVDLPPGPVWALHAFYLNTTGLMLYWYVRYSVLREGQRRCRWAWLGFGRRRRPVRLAVATR
ncbi:MAG TPA: hypothetical protein VIL37_20970 [Natronosporangium sp.]